MSKVIFITGATSGFGAASARLFAKNGWRVVATGRRVERLEALRDEFEPGTIHIAPMDLTDRDSIVAVISELPNDFKVVTCLLNNGGLALGVNSVPDIQLEDWRTMVETNIMGLIHTTQEMIPLLKTAGKGAAIINIGSIASHYAYPGGNVYGATKAFVRQFSANLRTDLANTHIRVTDIEPGLSKTEFSQVRNYGDEQASEKMYGGVEPILPEDIADTVWWLANRPPHINIGALDIMPMCQVAARPTIMRD